MDGTYSGGVGLTNTDKRLKSIFGPGSGLRILSNEWGYTVSFFIPFEDAHQDSVPVKELNKAV